MARKGKQSKPTTPVEPAAAPPPVAPLDVDKTFSSLLQGLMEADRAGSSLVDAVYMRKDVYDALCASSRYGASIEIGSRGVSVFRGRPIVLMLAADADPFHFGRKTKQ